jgi:ppGpp synthetase/RelA/SpoT-type nucleotidyltranferase/thymidylate synthase ThyX
VDGQFFDRLTNEPLEDMPEWQHPPRESDAAAREFDARLDGKTSVLVDCSANAVAVMADAYRAVVGLTRGECGDAEAIDRLLNPARNPYRLQTLNIGVHAPMMRALQHASYTFAKKISHTADSQDQRHRMVPGSRPLLVLTDTRQPDFVVPMLIAGHARAREVYERAMAEAWAAKNELLDRGVPVELALYLLPNAKAIRLVETGSLLHLLHKWTMRTCFNAQEEIYQASMEEIEQVRAVHPQLARYIGPPCHLRAGITTPICTEGSHFCGVKVWLDFPNTMSVKHAQDFERVKPRFEEALDLILVHIRHLLRGQGLMHPDELSHRVTGRIKATKSFLKKVRRIENQSGKKFRSFSQTINRIDDIAGMRVVCNYLEEVLLVYGYIRQHPAFTEIKGKFEDYIHRPKLGYRALHTVVSIQTSFGLAKCEIQIRTALQDAWAVKSHALVYKLKKTDLSRVPRQIRNLLIQQSHFLYTCDQGAEEIASLIRDTLQENL